MTATRGAALSAIFPPISVLICANVQVTEQQRSRNVALSPTQRGAQGFM